MDGKSFGTSKRFKDPKTSKVKNVMNPPGPGKYEMIAYWKGKSLGKKQ